MTGQHLAASRQRLLDEMKQNPGVRYERSGEQLQRLAETYGYNPLTLDTSLVELANKGHISKERVGRKVYYSFQKNSSTNEDFAIKRPSRRRVSYTVTYSSRDEDGYIVASVPALPGCHSQGKTREEAGRNIREAMSGYLASLKHRQQPFPEEEVEQVEVAV